ncbi:MAG TPA: hypothetical protein VFB02_15245 [Bradyrhizobium sp.]|nr:hypothetical protein [Bradyrhizobium sp.]
MNTMEESAAMTEASGLAGDRERIDHAADAIRGMTKDIADNQPGRQRRISELIRQATIEAPLQSLAVAFLLGVLVARRR